MITSPDPEYIEAVCAEMEASGMYKRIVAVWDESFQHYRIEALLHAPVSECRFELAIGQDGSVATKVLR